MTENTPKPPVNTQKRNILLGIAACLLIGGFVFGRMMDIPASFAHDTQEEKKAETKKEPLLDADISDTLGKASDVKIFEDDLLVGDTQNPKAVFIEYASMTCPHCAHFHNGIAKKLKDHYKDKEGVLFIYRDFPLDKYALMGAKIAHCDPEKRQGFTDLLYQKQESWIKGTGEEIEKNLKLLSKVGGLSNATVEKCLTDKALAKKIISVRKYGIDQFKVTATPFILVNGDNLKLGKDLQYYQEKIDINIK